jgi:hypothetical protein
MEEKNRPNTLDGCKDGDKGDYLDEESIEAIKISAIGGSSRLEKGGEVKIKATVWAWDDGQSNEADFYWADDANDPTWKYIGSKVPDAGGDQKLTIRHTIPEGTNIQAARVVFRYEGSRDESKACGGGDDDGDYDDADDMVVYVAEKTTTPSPTTGHPTSPPTEYPTKSPSKSPTTAPTTPSEDRDLTSSSPTASPSGKPSKSPTQSPTQSPTSNPTPAPTPSPTPGSKKRNRRMQRLLWEQLKANSNKD